MSYSVMLLIVLYPASGAASLQQYVSTRQTEDHKRPLTHWPGNISIVFVTSVTFNHVNAMHDVHAVLHITALMTDCRPPKQEIGRYSLSASSAAKAVSASASLFIMSRALRTSFFLMVFNESCCCRFSRDTWSGKVSESTIPCTKLRYLQITGEAVSAVCPVTCRERVSHIAE